MNTPKSYIIDRSQAEEPHRPPRRLGGDNAARGAETRRYTTSSRHGGVFRGAMSFVV